METKDTWLIYYKASFSDRSPMNMDGSTFGYCVAIVPEKDLRAALERFEAELAADFMELMEIYQCVHHGTEPFQYESELLEHLEETVQMTISRNVVSMLGIGNESFPEAENALHDKT